MPAPIDQAPQGFNQADFNLPAPSAASGASVFGPIQAQDNSAFRFDFGGLDPMQFATGSPDGFNQVNPAANFGGGGGGFFDGFQIGDLFGAVPSIAGSIFPFVQESNRSDATLASIRAQQTVALSSRGFSDGRATLDPTIAKLSALGAPTVGLPSFGGAGAITAQLSQWIPLVLLALVAGKLLK